MGLRFRKSINLGGGFRLNISKSGIGYSWGCKGFRVTKTANGRIRKTYSIPGTGISYVKENKISQKHNATPRRTTVSTSKNKIKYYTKATQLKQPRTNNPEYKLLTICLIFWGLYF